MNNHLKELLGSLLSTIGTIQAAIGNTPQFYLPEKLNKDLQLMGNVLQAVGSALTVDGQGSVSLEKIGGELQAVGNSTVVAGMVLYNDSDQDVEQRMSITGTWIQALGSFVGLADEFFDQTEDGRMEAIIGNLLQGIGNSLQAIGGIQVLHHHPSTLGIVGSWIQSIGSVFSLIGQILEEREEIRLTIDE